jgi:hypothetical protein
MEWLHNIGTHPFDLDGLLQYGGMILPAAGLLWNRLRKRSKEG